VLNRPQPATGCSLLRNQTRDIELIFSQTLPAVATIADRLHRALLVGTGGVLVTRFLRGWWERLDLRLVNRALFEIALDAWPQVLHFFL